MSTSVTEVAILNGNDALKADPGLFDELTQFVQSKGAAGMQRQAWGFRIEEPGTWMWLIDWESLEHHKRARAEPPSNSGFKEKLASLLASPPTVVHVPFAPFEGFTQALAAPVTEVASVRIKPGIDSKKVSEVVETTLGTVGEYEGCIGCAWGRQVEDDNVVLLVLGWRSIKAHEAFARTESFKTVGKVFGQCFSAHEMSHVKFQRK